jgi:hypothetical protein
MAKQFDKQEWLEKKAVKLEDAREALDAGLKALRTSDDWKHLLEAMAVRGSPRRLRSGRRRHPGGCRRPHSPPGGPGQRRTR